MDHPIREDPIAYKENSIMVARRYITILLGISAILLILSRLGPASAAVSETAAAPSPIYWGVLINGVPFDMQKLQTFEHTTGKSVSIIHWGQPWVMNNVAQTFPSAAFDKVRTHGSIPMLNWGSWHLGYNLNQPYYQLHDIYEGVHDGYIRRWATDAKAWGHPFFLRFNHEMNGWWYPWSEQTNGNQPGDYVKAWRHVHDIFTQVGATNVTWVWCVNIIGDPNSTPINSLYPGDKFVDWVAIDGYNTGTDRNGEWRTLSEVLKDTYDSLTTLYPTKPLMIAEFASSEDGGPLGRPDSKAAWIRDAFTTELPLMFPKVKAVVWFNWNVEEPGIDWPIESSTASIQSFATAIRSRYYATNSFAGLNTSPIPPLVQPQLKRQVWLPFQFGR
jgi:hypothetical protein